MSEPAANGVGADGDLHDMKAVWDRWISILRRHGWGPDAVLQAPSTDAEIDAALEKAGSLSLPAAVRELYLLNDGQESPSNVANIATNIFPGLVPEHYPLGETSVKVSAEGSSYTLILCHQHRCLFLGSSNICHATAWILSGCQHRADACNAWHRGCTDCTLCQPDRLLHKQTPYLLPYF